MQVQTVTGRIPSSALGYTLTHEHFQLDFHHFYSAPPAHLHNYFEKPSFSIESLGFIRQYPYSLKYNLNFCDVDTQRAVTKDACLFKQWGGGTIVENTSHGLRRDLKFMEQVAKESGVNVVAGTGHYVSLVQDQSTLALTTEQMERMYVKDLMDGDENGIKCGVIGEVGSSWPIDDFEKRAIEAAALARDTTNVGVTFHPGRDSKAPFEIVRLYLEAGGKANRCVMSHIDRTIMDTGEMLEFAKLGTFVQMDLFGTECSFYQLNPSVDMISDAERIKKVQALIDDGRTDQILMSHDIHTKHRLIEYGGHGYSHILNNVLPKMKLRGCSTETINTITVENPRRWLETPY